MESFLSQIYYQTLQNLNKEKQRIFVQKLNEKGFTIDLMEQRGKKFKDVLIINEDEKEHWFYNNGTNEGLKVVTFYPKEPSFLGNEVTVGFLYD